MNKLLLTFCLLFSINILAQEELLIDSALNKAGKITYEMTEQDLVNLFGKENVATHDIYAGEGEYIKGTVIFPNTPSKRAYLSWKDSKAKKYPWHFIVKDLSTIWKSTNNLTAGIKLKDVEKLNGKSFLLVGYDVHGTGNVSWWNEGNLEGTEIGVRFVMPDADEFSREERKIIFKKYPYTVPSDIKTMQKNNPIVDEIVYVFRYE